MGGDNLPLGGKPSGKEKGINLTKRVVADARKKAQNQPPQMQAEVALVDEFGDGSIILREWRNIAMIIGIVLNQKADICWGIALTRLLQAIFNINKKTVADCKEFVHDDIVAHLKLKTPKKNDSRTSLKLKNLKDAINHIAVKGLLKVKSSGYARPGNETGFHGKWNFNIEKCSSADFIKSKVEISPVVLSFEVGANFHYIGKGIYEVTGADLEEGEVGGHAVLVVAYGYTKERRLFFVIQNSWGDQWGVKGFGRIFIGEQSNTTLVYPDPQAK